MENLIQLYSKIPEELLHYVYGVNCFQHAIGFRLPILFSTKLINRRLGYISLQPGHPSTPSPHREPSLEKYAQKVLEYCRDEGLIYCGSRLTRREGYRTLAFYTKERNGVFDPHYAFLNEQNKWESKFMFEPAIPYANVKEAGRGYDFRCYLLAPDNLIPLAIKEWNPTPARIISSTGKILSLCSLDDGPVNDDDRVSGQIMLFYSERKVAAYLDPDEGFRPTVLYPLPPWPPIDNPTEPTIHFSHLRKQFAPKL